MGVSVQARAATTATTAPTATMISFVDQASKFDSVAQNVVQPTVVGALNRASAATGVQIPPEVPLEHAGAACLGISLFFMGAGALLTLLGNRTGFLFLMLFLLPVTLLRHNFWDKTGDAYEHALRGFLMNVSLFGSLLLLYSSSGRAAPRRSN